MYTYVVRCMHVHVCGEVCMHVHVCGEVCMHVHVHVCGDVCIHICGLDASDIVSLYLCVCLSF